MRNVEANETYIEKPKYFKDRAVIVKRVTNRNVFVFNFNLKSLRLTNTRIRLEDFKKRFEKSWLQLIVR